MNGKDPIDLELEEWLREHGGQPLSQTTTAVAPSPATPPPEREWPRPYPLQKEDGTPIDAFMRRDYSIWVGDEQVGIHNPRTDDFEQVVPEGVKREQTWRELYETTPTTAELAQRSAGEALTPVLKGLEYGLYPFAMVGMETQKAIEQPPFLSLPERERERAALLARGEKPPSFMEQLKEILPGGTKYEEYRDQPWYKQILSELPAWLATGGIGATSIRQALAKAAEKETTRLGLAAATTRGVLAPVAGAEWVMGQASKWVIGKPLSYVFGKVAKVAGKISDAQLRAAFEKTPVYQGMKPEFKGTTLEDDIFNAFKLWRGGKTQPAEQVMESVFKNFKAGRYGAPAKPVPETSVLPPEKAPITPKAPVIERPPVIEKPVVPEKAIIPKVAPKLIESVTRKAEISKLLATPAKELPKGTQKIALRQELSKINAKLVPAEKQLRQQIMAQVRTLGLPESQYRKIFMGAGGSRRLTNLSIEKLPKVLEAVKVARPVSLKGKRVITPKTEALIQSSKQDLIDQNILTEETYQGILKGLKLSTDKYTGKELFISETEARSILKEMRNRAILAPLGELKFGKPTAIKNLTSQTYYAQVLGVKPLVEPLELAKVDFDLAHRAMSASIDKQIGKVKKSFGKDAVAKLRDLLDKFEEAPAELTAAQKESFNWFRNLNRTIINGENEVRRGLGMPEIPYREAYVRHVPDVMAEAILRGEHPLPPSLEYWSRRIVSKKIFNPMAMHRQLSDDLAKLYTKDLARASKNMVYTGLKEIHLAQPLKAFTEQMGALSDVMPASTRKWVTDYVNQVIKGQQTEWDANLNRLVTESGIGGLINAVLRPYRLSLGTQPVTKLAQQIGRGTLLAVLALPRPKLARLMIRNTFQRTQELALHNPLSVLKGFAFERGKLAELMSRSRFLKSYTGVEEWPAELMGKVEKVALAPYQSTAVINARQAMRTTYYDVIDFFTKPKYKDLGWALPQRTYTEPKGFLYPEEEALMLKEMEWAARVTQYQYIGMGMPEIFRNKTLIPLTRLQSWWMNYFCMFHREAGHRFWTGTTQWGGKLPWTKRVNYLTYLLLGGAILTSMGYTSSYLWNVLPYNLSPVGQFAIGLLTYVGADTDWERENGKKEIYSAWKAMIPGPMAYEEFQKIWSGEMPLWQMFFYGREEEGIPPRPPTWGIINREPALNMKVAKKDITEAEGQLGKVVPTELPEPYFYIDEQGEQQLYTPTGEEYVYTTVDLGAAIKRATLKLEDRDITADNKFSPLTLFYKESEGMWDAYYYSLPSSPSSVRTDFRESSDGAYIEAYLFFWGKLTVLRNDYSEDIVRGWMNKYNIPEEAIPALSKGETSVSQEENLKRLDFLRRQQSPAEGR